MVFEALVVVETVLCALMVVGAVRLQSQAPPAPEVVLGQRAWVAARFGMAEAKALGPLFKHLERTVRGALREAHRQQEQIRSRHAKPAGVLSPLVPPLMMVQQVPRRQRSEQLAELSHLVEQLEQMTIAIARYRGGIGMLAELRVPMRCLQAQAGPRARVRR